MDTTYSALGHSSYVTNNGKKNYDIEYKEKLADFEK